MNIIIVYDSLFGNTKKIAEKIASVAKASHTVRMIAAPHVKISDLRDTDLLIIGSPTHGGKPKTDLQSILDQIPGRSLVHTCIAAFDTRFDESKQNILLRLLMKTIGYAAPKIQALLEQKGGTAIIQSEGFVVLGKNGPLQHGELERAALWMKTILSLEKIMQTR